MKLQTNLVLLLGLSMCFSVFAQSNLVAYKRSISSAPFEQVFELGLKGVGSCKIVPAFLKGIRTWRVTTTKPRPGIKGDGVLVGLDVHSSFKVAHGFAWTPEFLTTLKLPHRFFNQNSYAAFKNSDSRQNAVLMLRKAVNEDLCNLTSSSFPEAQSVNISNFTPEKIKQSFTFYVDSSRKISCTSSLHSKPVFNPATCRYESKKIAIGASACKRAYQKASVSGRATVTAKNDKSKKPKFFPPVLEALTPEIEREMLISELPFETHVMAAHASEKLDIQAVIDPSLIPVKANLGQTDELELADRFKHSLDEAKGDFTKPQWLSSAFDEIKIDPRFIAYKSAITDYEAPVKADVINDSKFNFLEPIKQYYPKLNLAASGCQTIEHFEVRNIDNSTMRAD